VNNLPPINKGYEVSEKRSIDSRFLRWLNDVIERINSIWSRLSGIVSDPVILNIIDFGADPANDAQTNREAIQATIDYFHNNPGYEYVYIPEGVFLIDAYLTVKSNIQYTD
jgi:hypothetical protein